jgi:NADH-quinone oxidoreductase subunit H
MLENLFQNRILIETIIAAIKIFVIFHAMLIAVPMFVLLERKLIAWMQQRPGPNRVGPWGILQTLVDGGKLFLKEDVKPAVVEKTLYTLAPLLTVVPAILVLAIVPIGPALGLNLYGNDYLVNLGIADLKIGILFYLAITGIGVYGIVIAGWASNSKYSLLGGIRSSAQMLSYEIALGLSMVGVLLIAGTFELRQIIGQQDGGFWNWHILKQPVGFLLFLCAGFAETNRLPFDLPEGESELGAGFHTEYSSMKFALFFQAEYMNMFTFSAILTTLFLGGYHSPIPAPEFMAGILNSPIHLTDSISVAHIGAALAGCFWFSIKILALISFMIFIRGTWPRLRYDQLMDWGWKLMFPVALVNLFITSGIIAFWPPAEGVPRADIMVEPADFKLGLTLFVAGVLQILIYDWYLTRKKRRFLANAA